MDKRDDALYYMEFGEVAIDQADDINIPVDCWIVSPKGVSGEDCTEGSDNYWHWYADNYQPRRGLLVSLAYHIAAENKKDIIAAVRRYVVPLYQVCMKSLAADGVTSWFVSTETP